MRHCVSGEQRCVMKLRGITRDRRNDNVLTHQRFKEMVLNAAAGDDEVYFNYQRIGADKRNQMFTRSIVKLYRTVYNKGFIRYNTIYPFGYRLE